MFHAQTRSHGFTFLELLLVISLVIILSFSATAFYARFLTQNAVDNVADQMVASFRKAQLYSMISKQSNTNTWGVQHTGGANTFTFFLTGNSAYTETYNINNNITVTAFNITFAHATGVPSGGVFPQTITMSSTTSNSSKNITINAQGIVSRNN